MQERLESLEAKYESLTRDLMDPQVQAQSSVFVEKAKRHADLEQVVGLIKRRREVESHWDQAQELARGGDPEMAALAKEEISGLQGEREALDESLKLALLPKDPSDGKPVYVEIRPGTGGDEAALFAGVLLRMYTRWAENRGWGVELISAVEGEVGGFKEAIVLVKGAQAWRLLKNEAGVHRVQRVPVTEAGGRIHTSTATVMVLPEAEPRDMSIDERDLKWETFQ